MSNFIDFIKNITQPKSTDWRVAQKEYILNVVLLGLVFVSGMLFLLSSIYRIVNFATYNGESPIVVFFALFVFFVLYAISRSGRVKIAKWLLLILFALFANIVAIKSGVENPTSLLLFAWVFTLTGILMARWSALTVYFLTVINLLTITFLQINGKLLPDLHWKAETLDFSVSLSYVIILLVIAVISSLYNREITNSLSRALQSEADLEKERMLLEERVLQRTKELEKAQIEQINQLAKFAEFGKSMSGLLHDLINPITAISLNLGELKNITDDSKVEGVREYSQRAMSAASKMEEFVVSTKNKLRNQQEIKRFEIKKEIEEVAKFFVFKAKKKEIEISINVENDLYLMGDVVKFDQVISNLISNSIDAFDNVEKERRIDINVVKSNGHAKIVFEDNASGIKQNLIDEIFKPFFTTKKRREGIGIGLYITKNIVEGDFGGLIEVSSVQGEGTKFIILLPIENEKK